MGTGLRIAVVGQGTKPIPAEGYAPIETHVAALVAALRRRGEEVHLVNRVWRPFRLRLLLHALWAHRQLRRIKPDVVHVHSNVNARVLRRLGDRPLVFTTHSRQWAYNGTPGAEGNRNLRNDRRGYLAADARILLSHQAREAVARSPELRDLPWRVIPNGVDPARFPPPMQQRTGRVVVGLGVIDPVKRWHLVAEALAGTGWTFEVLGPIANPDYAARLRAANPNIVLRGEVSQADLLATLHRARVMAHPSEAEGMPLAVLEGMATGLPVVGGATLEGIVEPGRSGAIVPESGEAEQVAAYRRLFERTPEAQWDAMGAAGRARVLERFTWDQVAEQTCAVYAEAARRVQTLK